MPKLITKKDDGEGFWGLRRLWSLLGKLVKRQINGWRLQEMERGMERGEGLSIVILREFVRRIFSEERTDAMGF